MSPERPRAEDGIALVLAVLALALLTALALALSASTSLELQSATNYRWQQQAYYNADAGIEVGRRALRTMSWGTLLPTARGTWLPGAAPLAPPTPPFVNARNFDHGPCDRQGNGVGYGVVLDDGGPPPSPYQDVTALLGQQLNGSVTLWIRRALVVNGANDSVSDDPDDDVLVLTSEGRAPWAGPASGAQAQPHVAVRAIEATLRRHWTGVVWDVWIDHWSQEPSACR